MSSPTTTPRVSLSVADLTLRPATLDDAAFVADLLTAVQPDDPEDPVMTRYWWSAEDPNHVATERYVALRDGRPAGFAQQRHVVWEKMPERFGGVSAEVLPELRTAERLDALHAFAEDRSRADGTRTLTAWSWEWDELRLGVLHARGYREERRERFWELDLVANRGRLAAMAAASRAKMREQGVRILTLDRDPDPEKCRKLWRVSEEAEQDVPTTVPHVATPFAQFMKWMKSPGLREDRIWIAKVKRGGAGEGLRPAAPPPLGDDIVGVSMLSYPSVRGVVQTDWTGTARSVRGKGVARALKCETVMQAIALGVTRVRTDNDGQNAPILHLNETMGYRRRPDMIQLMRPA